MRYWLMLILAMVGGCQASSGSSGDLPGPGRSAAHDDRPMAGEANERWHGAAPLAYIDGWPVDESALMPALIEAAGGQTLSDLVIDRGLEKRLDQAGVKITSDDVQREKRIMLRTLAPATSGSSAGKQAKQPDAESADQAVRILREIRRRRGLGKHRFAALLRRNAGLRRLVRDQVSITDAQVHKAYDQQYGKQYRTRLIVAATQAQAAKLREQAKPKGDEDAKGKTQGTQKAKHAGKTTSQGKSHGQPGGRGGHPSFAELAARHSIDPSASRGGLLSPISPLDAGYPQAVRNALDKLKPGQLTGVIALDSGYAVLKLEKIIEPKEVDFADVKKKLRRELRRRKQRVAMDELARTIIQQADVTVLNRPLKKTWQTQRRGMTAQP